MSHRHEHKVVLVMTTTSATVLTPAGPAGPAAGPAGLRPAVSRSSLGLGLAVLSAASFGTSGSFARSLTAVGWSPAAAVVARIGVASLLLSLPCFLPLPGPSRAPPDSR